VHILLRTSGSGAQYMKACFAKMARESFRIAGGRGSSMTAYGFDPRLRRVLERQCLGLGTRREALIAGAVCRL
jgi:hypothetical protein